MVNFKAMRGLLNSTCTCIVSGFCSKGFVKPQSQAFSCYLQVSYPFLPFLLSLSLSLVITVKVQLRRLRSELSQRCVTAMWRFTRLVTKKKPPAIIHTCGTIHTNIHTQPYIYISTSLSTCGHIISPSASSDKTSGFSFSLLLSRNSYNKKLHQIVSVCSCLVKTLLFTNDSLASSLIASCSLSFVISCRLWHFHKLSSCAISGSSSKRINVARKDSAGGTLFNETCH